MYDLHFASTFAPTYKALVKHSQELEKRIEKALKLLKNDPFYPSLKSHKVNTRNFGEKWSSRENLLFFYLPSQNIQALTGNINKQTAAN